MSWKGKETRDNTFFGSVIEVMMNSDVSFEGGRLVHSKAVIMSDARCRSNFLISMVTWYQEMDRGNNMQ
jgi:hypothetical protein